MFPPVPRIPCLPSTIARYCTRGARKWGLMPRHFFANFSLSAELRCSEQLIRVVEVENHRLHRQVRFVGSVAKGHTWWTISVQERRALRPLRFPSTTRAGIRNSRLVGLPLLRQRASRYSRADFRFRSCPWRIAKFMRRSVSDTTLGNVSATDTSLNLSLTRHRSARAGALPIQRAIGDHYSNVEIRAASSPDRPSSKIASGLGIRAESCRSAARQRDAKVERKEPS